MLIKTTELQQVLELHGFEDRGFEQHWFFKSSKKFCSTRKPWAVRIFIHMDLSYTNFCFEKHDFKGDFELNPNVLSCTIFELHGLSLVTKIV